MNVVPYLLVAIGLPLFVESYTCNSVGGKKPLAIKSTFVNTTTLPRNGKSISPAAYNGSIFMVGGDNTIEIDVIDAANIDVSNNSNLWRTSLWQPDSNYGTIDDMISLQQQVQIGQYLYMAGVGSGENTDRLLIYDLKTQQQVDSSKYNYIMPICGEGSCMLYFVYCTVITIVL